MATTTLPAVRSASMVIRVAATPRNTYARGHLCLLFFEAGDRIAPALKRKER